MKTGYCILFINVMTNKKWIPLILFLAGLIILLLPDRGKPVIVLNKKHGPSLPDLVGLVIMMTGWLWSCIAVFENRNEVIRRTGKRISGLFIILYVLSVIGISLSLLFSFELILWSCTAIAACINILFIIYSFNKK